MHSLQCTDRSVADTAVSSTSINFNVEIAKRRGFDTARQADRHVIADSTAIPTDGASELLAAPTAANTPINGFARVDPQADE